MNEWKNELIKEFMKEKSFKKSGDKERKKGEKRKVWKMGKIREDSGSEKKPLRRKWRKKYGI